MQSTSSTVVSHEEAGRKPGSNSKRQKSARTKSTAARKSSSKIAGLVPILAFQGDNEDLWPTLASFRWFIRNNRAQLLNHGALLEISGRAFVHVENFKIVVLKVGRRQASKGGDQAETEDQSGY